MIPDPDPKTVLVPVHKEKYNSVTNLKRGETLLGPAGQVNMHTSAHTWDREIGEMNGEQ